eukprot:357208-Chlamydomonas_euryale.AAC.5
MENDKMKRHMDASTSHRAPSDDAPHSSSMPAEQPAAPHSSRGRRPTRSTRAMPMSTPMSCAWGGGWGEGRGLATSMSTSCGGEGRSGAALRRAARHGGWPPRRRRRLQSGLSKPGGGKRGDMRGGVVAAGRTRVEGWWLQGGHRWRGGGCREDTRGGVVANGGGDARRVGGKWEGHVQRWVGRQLGW